MISLTASSLRPAKFDPDEIRRITAGAKARGDLLAPGQPVTIDKRGETVARGSGLNSQWIDVTPEKAAHWLHNNFRNRPLRDDVVDAYARDMANGAWAATHQGIAFNDRNELIDGQHRLTAIVRSGATVRMMVTFDLPSEIAGSKMTRMDAIDRGATRSVADQLTIQHGLANGRLIAMVCAGLANLCAAERTRRLSVGQTLEIYDAYRTAVDWVIERRSKEVGLKAAGVMAGFAFALHTGKAGGRVSEIEAMHVGLMSGKTAREHSAIRALRAFLTSPDAKLLSRGSDRALAELVLQAIWLAERGEHVEVLTLAQDGAAHYRTLQPERVEKIAAMFRLPKR